MLFLLAFAIAEGAITASFISLVVARLPRLLRESADDRVAHVLHGISFPRSHCPCCKASVRPRDLAPVIAYVALRGRSRDCGFAFGSRELVMELAGAGIGLGSVLLFGFSLAALGCFCGLSVLLGAIAIALNGVTAQARAEPVSR